MRPPLDPPAAPRLQTTRARYGHRLGGARDLSSRSLFGGRCRGMRINANYIRPVDSGTTRRLTVLLASCVLAACSGGGHSSKSSATTVPAAVAPRSGNLYEPPQDMRPAAPGTRIWTQFYAQTAKSELFGVATKVWSMLYHSRDRGGRDIAVSGFVVVPQGRAPASGRPVY